MTKLSNEDKELIYTELNECDPKELYDDYLDNLHSSVCIAGLDFEPSDILYNCNREVYYKGYRAFRLEYLIDLHGTYYNKIDVEELFKKVDRNG